MDSVREDLVKVIRIHGSFSVDISKGFLEKTRSWILKSRGSLLLDMTDVTDIGGGGLHALFVLWRDLRSRHRSFALCGLSAEVRSVMDTTGFLSVFLIFPTRQEARIALSFSFCA